VTGCHITLKGHWCDITVLNVHAPTEDKDDDIKDSFYEELEQVFDLYASEVIGDHQCRFRRNRSTMDQIFYIRQILEKKWEYNGTVHQLFIDFKKDCHSVKREVFTKFCLSLV
jgi:predicted nucleotidyltransferase